MYLQINGKENWKNIQQLIQKKLLESQDILKINGKENNLLYY